MAASMWEVTRLILGEPGDAAGIAHAHGFTTAQVADLLPLFADNVTVAWDGAGGAPPAPFPGPGETPEDLAARWLGELGAQRAAGTLDVVSYDSFGAAAFGLDGADPGVDLDFDDAGPPTGAFSRPDAADLGGSDEGFGAGPASTTGDDEPDREPDEAPDREPDEAPEPDLDDPFDLGPAATGGPDGGVPADPDAGPDLDDPSDGGAAFD
ncbi:MAG: hypothetical protein ACT4RN_19255 [Pseudonocardia sp.]